MKLAVQLTRQFIVFVVGLVLASVPTVIAVRSVKASSSQYLVVVQCFQPSVDVKYLDLGSTLKMTPNMAGAVELKPACESGAVLYETREGAAAAVERNPSGVVVGVYEIARVLKIRRIYKTVMREETESHLELED